MATPDAFTMTRNGGRFIASRILATNVGVSTDGIWYDTLQLHPFTITISVSSDFAVTTDQPGLSVLVSNGILGYSTDQKTPIIVPPANSDNNWPTLGPESFSTVYSVLSDGPYRFVKLRSQNITAGTYSASWSAAVVVSEKG